MKRVIIHATSFTRASKRYLKKHPDADPALVATLMKMAEDVFAPSLRTHKLKGRFADQWACSGDYDLRIIFQFVQHEGAEAILLLSVGTHDEVY